MPTRNNTLPLGMLLENAGLIDDKQLQHALELQSKYPQMKLGEILVLKEGIKSKTISFFVDKWQEIQKEGQQFPIGYYLKNASLLSDQQIETILTEQKVNKLKFGDIAVHKGWLKQNTINFFLNSLSIKPQQPLSLIALEKYNQENLYLERKYANPSLILSRVLGWTGGNPPLTLSICHVFADSNFSIPAGLEANAVDQFVEKSLIKDWQTSKIGTYIRTIENNLVNNQRCSSISLLEEYREILLSDSKQYQQTKEQKELLILGLVVQQKNKLKVNSLIYQQVFNQDWIDQELSKLKLMESTSQIATNSIGEITDHSRLGGKHGEKHEVGLGRESKKPFAQTTLTKYVPANPSDNTETTVEIDENTNVPDPITRIGSLFILGGIILLIPLAIAVNNYYLPAKQQKIANPQTSEANRLSQFCNDLNLSEPKLASNLISQLEKNKQEILKTFPNKLETFPENCETVLNKLRILAAPQLGKQNRVLEAVKNLCNIPSDSESFNEAKVWLEHWENSLSWGKETQSYLNLVSHCPANDQ